MICPACSTAMHEAEIAGIQVEECGGCRGLWLDRRAWARARARFGRSAAPSIPLGELEPLPCPSCGTITLRGVAAEGNRSRRCERCRGRFVTEDLLPRGDREWTPRNLLALLFEGLLGGPLLPRFPPSRHGPRDDGTGASRPGERR